jgi:hypothetical protein
MPLFNDARQTRQAMTLAWIALNLLVLRRAHNRSDQSYQGFANARANAGRA